MIKESICDYTVNKMPFDEGFKKLVLELESENIDYTVYLDIESEDISSMPTVDYKGNVGRYYNQKITLLEWKTDGISSVINNYPWSDLEELLNSNDIKEYRKEFLQNYKDEFIEYIDESEDEEDAFINFMENYWQEYTGFLLSDKDMVNNEDVLSFLLENYNYYVDKIIENYNNFLCEQIKERKL